MSFIPGLGRSPGRGNDNLFQYSCLGNPMDRRAWRAKVQRVPKSQTQLSAHTHRHRHSAFYQPCNWHQYHFLLKSTPQFQCTWEVGNIFWTFFKRSFTKRRTEFPSFRWKYWNSLILPLCYYSFSHCIWLYPEIFSASFLCSQHPSCLSPTYHSLLSLHIGSKPLIWPLVCPSSPRHRAQWEGQGGSSREGPSLERVEKLVSGLWAQMKW